MKKEINVKRKLFEIKSIPEWNNTIQDSITCSLYNNNVGVENIIMVDQSGNVFNYDCELELFLYIKFPIEAFLI